MRAALYHPWVYLRSGIERSFAELIARSRHDWVIYTHHHEPASTYPELAGADVRALMPEVSVRRSFGPLLHASATMMRASLPTSGERALLVSSEGLGDLVTFRARVPVAAYCHTPLKIVHDPETRAALVDHDKRKAAALGVLAPVWNVADRRAWRRYRHVFVNSEETRRRVTAARLRPSGPLEVLHPGVDTSRFHRASAASHASGAREPFLLVAGRIMWQKNIELAIDTARLLVAAGAPTRLVVAGAVDVKSAEYVAALRRRITDLGLDELVEVIADPPDEVLVDLYRRCLLLLFTARNEDFGMVPLEAMACGAPVLAVDRGGPRETIVDGRTGWLRSGDPEAFAQVIEAARRDPDSLESMRAACVEHASRFGWDAFVGRIDDVMEEIGTGP